MEFEATPFDESDRMTSQRIGKYACLEIERRYLLRTMPDDLPADVKSWHITDRYFPHTRLRLRHMKSMAADENIYKLTQKYRSGAQNASETTITNIYLTEAEYNVLQPLEAQIIRKRRYPYRAEDHNFSIDVFEGRHQGLILAEIEFEKGSALDGFTLPLFALKDVTEDPFFSGGSLAIMSDEEFRQGLSQREI